MRTWVRLTLVAFTASLLLSAAAGTGSARNLSFSEVHYRITWSELEFMKEVTIRCPVTLEGSFHKRSIVKSQGTLIGLVTRAIVNQAACREGRVSAFNGAERYNGGVPANTLPWVLRYDSFTGRLPAIASINVLLSRFRFGVEALGCAVQFGSEIDNVLFEAALAGGAITTLTPVVGRNEAIAVETDRDPFGVCPRPGQRGWFTGEGNVTVLGAATRITLTLI